MEALGGRHTVLETNYYRRTGDSACLVLPPVGSAWCAVSLIECIEHYEEKKIFNNPNVQIQVCSPGRLDNKKAGLLTLAFHLGSDYVRGYDLNRLETTFSDGIASFYGQAYLPRGRRITIYDGRGALDRDFELWTLGRRGKKRRRVISRRLPFKHERTDVLTATSRVDIYNINFLATLLVHMHYGWFWRGLGALFLSEMTAILRAHQLEVHMDAPWISSDFNSPELDDRFLEAMNEVTVYALTEVARVNARRERTGILYETASLIQDFRKRHRDRVAHLTQEGTLT
jgi:hypothetical protein